MNIYPLERGQESLPPASIASFASTRTGGAKLGGVAACAKVNVPPLDSADVLQAQLQSVESALALMGDERPGCWQD